MSTPSPSTSATAKPIAAPAVAPSVGVKPLTRVPVPSSHPPRAVAPLAPGTRPAAPAVQPASKNQPAWRTFFEGWPAEIPRRGILVTKLNEPCQFKSFMLRGDFVLLERVTPDSMGGRFLVMQCDEIAAVKFTDPLKQPALEAAGFKGQLAK